MSKSTSPQAGHFQGTSASFQIRFGSETDLELIDAAIFYESTMIRCEPRNTKLEGGNNWNSFEFSSAELPFIPNEIISLKIRVCDHTNHCCDLFQELQMQQYYPTINPGKNFGRWEIHTLGIPKIRCSENKKF